MKSPLVNAAIHINDLTVWADQRCLLRIPQLLVCQGERIALVGQNGAGKSTLLRVLGGFLPATSGSVTVLGRSFGPHDEHAMTVARLRSLRAEVGQVMQGLHLVPRLTARENVVLGALARPGAMALWRSWLRLYPAQLVREADLALLDLGVLEHADTRADRLSGGERQKVSLARLTLQRPQLILADEPTSALDPNATLEACSALLSTAVGATLVSVVHDTALLPLLADRVIGLAGGQVIFDLSVKDASPERMRSLYAALPLPSAPLSQSHIAAPITSNETLRWRIEPTVS
jgi:phosphonate transport system ATP-binding protein